MIRCLLVLMLAGGVCSAGQPARAAGDAIPPECATKTRIVPRTPGWAFVMNFDVLDNGSPKGCLVLYRVVHAPTDFAPMTCKAVGGVNFAAGKGTFNGGHVFCDINIKQKLAALTPPAVVPAVDAYPFFTIVAAGTFSANTSLNLRSNPIGVYTPNTVTVPGLGMNVPIRAAQSTQLITRFNGVTSTTDIKLSLGPAYTLTVEHDGGPDIYTTTHYLDNSIAGQYSPRGPVSFFTDGGTFWIGADPAVAGETFRGTLDEVIFDPPDGGRPPLYASSQVLSFAPTVLKQP